MDDTEKTKLVVTISFGVCEFVNDSGVDHSKGDLPTYGEGGITGLEKTLILFHTEYYERYIIPREYVKQRLKSSVDHSINILPEGSTTHLRFVFEHRVPSWSMSETLKQRLGDKFTPEDCGSIENIGHGFQILLLTNVMNEDTQVCTKLEGTTGTLTYDTSKLRHNEEITFSNIAWFCPSLREYYPDVNPIKGRLSWINVFFEELPSDGLLGGISYAISSVTVELRRCLKFTNESDSKDSIANEEKIVQFDPKLERIRIPELLIRTKDESQEIVKRFILEDLTTFFNQKSVPLLRKAKLYYRLIYPITGDNVGIYNAYMSYMLHASSPRLGYMRIHYLFEAALARSPEFGSFDLWSAIINIRFAIDDDVFVTQFTVLSKADELFDKNVYSRVEALLKSVNGDFQFLFVKAIGVAVDLLTVYNNSIPYLTDLEHVPHQDMHTSRVEMLSFIDRWNHRKQQRSKTGSSRVSFRRRNDSKGRRRFVRSEEWGGEDTYEEREYKQSKTDVSVERFFSPQIGFGHDCEDGATYSVFLKCIIQMEYYDMQKQGNFSSSQASGKERLICDLGRIYELFNACLMGIYSKTGGEHEVFHIVTFLIPRYFLYEAKIRGKKVYPRFWKESPDKSCNPPNISKPKNVRRWEKDPTFYGSFVAEGTSVEEPYKFPMGEQGRISRFHYSRNFQKIARVLYNSGKPRGMMNRILFERKEFHDGDAIVNPFYIVANVFDHIDDPERLCQMSERKISKEIFDNLLAEPSEMSFVWFNTAHSEFNQGKPVYGVRCTDLFLRNPGVACYPIPPFMTKRGRDAFEVSVFQMKRNWPAFLPPPLPEKIAHDMNSPSEWPEHIRSFIFKMKENPQTKALLEKQIQNDVSDRLLSNRKNPFSKYVRFHALDVDLQQEYFQNSLISIISNLSKDLGYYALRYKVNYIQDTMYYPMIRKNEEKAKQSNGGYSISTSSESLYQVLFFLYY